MINCVIIEDEPLAQKGLVNLIKQFSNLSVLKVCDDVPEFLKFIEAGQQAIGLLFLDVELPGLKGIDFLRSFTPEAPVILTTAYHHYAIEAYELNVLDYLLKPVSHERFAQAIQKAESYIHFLNTRNSDQFDYLYVKSEKVLEKVFINEILMVEAMRNYVIYHCEKRKLISYNSLKNVEQSLPADIFIKVQKSFIINKNKVNKIEKGHVFVQGRTISLNRRSKNEIIKRLMNF